MNFFVHETADVDASAEIHTGAKIWHYAQVRGNAVIGENGVVGRGAYIGAGVVLGANCKIQNYALVYEPATLEDGVFIGPAVVLTNDHFPRAVNADLTPKLTLDWTPVGVTVRQGASIGASSTLVAPVEIGRWALVGAGSVVIRDVPDFALVVGSPARRVGWVGRAGEPLTLTDDPRIWRCPATGALYCQADNSTLTEVEHE
ncbi:MAG: N-acetyltransferase [Cryobacterium sp.]|nr:N-acetyltransferase [Cryobacterium sp.]